MFYDRFCRLCQGAGVTPSKVAEAVGVNKSTVYMWKKQGTTPKADTIQKLSTYFGCTVDYLLGKDDFPFPDLSGKTMTFQPITKTDSELIELGGFPAISEFYNLPKEAQKKALEDIRGFAEYVIEKYKKQSSDDK